MSSLRSSSFLVLVLALAAAALPLAAADYGAAKKKAAPVVEGVIVCQKCKHVGSWNLLGARPLPSAKVSITCKDRKRRVLFYRCAEADANGYFYAPLDGEGRRAGCATDFDPATACTVRLLASPDGRCDRLTNVNYGIQGAMLRYANKTVGAGEGYERELYAAGPLAFRPALCHPRTHY